MNEKIEDLLSRYAFSMMRSEILRTMGPNHDSEGLDIACAPGAGGAPPPQQAKTPPSPQIAPISSPLLERERNERQLLAGILEGKGHPVHTHRIKSRAAWATTEVLPYGTTENAAWFIEGVFIVIEVRAGLVEAYSETLRRITNAPVTIEKMDNFHVAGMESADMAKAWIEANRDKAGKLSLKGMEKIDIYLGHIEGPTESDPKH